MSKLDTLAEGRLQGMGFAHTIAKKAQVQGLDPVEAIDREIKSRTRNNIYALTTEAEWNHDFNSAFLAAYKTALIVAMSALWGDFGWGGRVRLPKFSESFINYIMEIGRGAVTVNDLVELLETKVGAKIDLDAKEFVVDFRKGKGGDIYK